MSNLLVNQCETVNIYFSCLMIKFMRCDEQCGLKLDANHECKAVSCFSGQYSFLACTVSLVIGAVPHQMLSIT